MPQFKTADIPPDYRDDLSPDMKNVIKRWVIDSTPINTALRYGADHEYFIDNPELFEDVLEDGRILSEAVNLSSLRQEYTVTRGLGSYDVTRVKQALDERNKTGVFPIILDKGFTSVSYQNDIAMGYADQDENGEIFLLASTLEKGYLALFIGNESTIAERKEGEILLQKESPYYITGEKTYISEMGIVLHLIDVVFL